MGKTKTAFVTENESPDKTGKEAYEAKMKKKAEKEAAAKAAVEKDSASISSKQASKEPKGPKKEKDQVKGVGLKGGERIKIVEPELHEEENLETTPIESTPETKKERKAKVRSNNYKSAVAKIDKNKNYKVVDAISLLKEIKYSKFDETVELHFVVKSKGQPVNITLPHSGGKQKKVEVADESTIEKLKSGKVDFDILLATADIMPKLVPFARILGPRGLMPNPKNGTLIKSKKDADKFSGNSLTLKTEKEQPVVHTAIGKLSQKDNEIEDNANAVLNAFQRQVVKAYIKSTMSPSLKLQV